MKHKIAWVAILLLVAFTFDIWFRELVVYGLPLDQNFGEFDFVGNIQSADDFWLNVTLRGYGFKHRFSADFSSGFSESDESSVSNEDFNNAVPVVPEFSSVIIVLTFTLISSALIVCKKKALSRIHSDNDI